MFGNNKLIIVNNTEGKDFKKETMTAYKTAIKFIGKPPKTRAAKRWIQNEMSRRNITKRK